LEIDPHAFPSEMLGETQRAITRLLRDTIPELAMRRPHTVVLIDEVESFAVSRTAASFSTNPVDVHRATDAVLAGIDAVAAELPRVLFLTTTNFVAGVDEAFLSRADLVVEFELPDPETVARIVGHSLQELAGLWPGLRVLADDTELALAVAQRCAGWDGRRVRKLVLAALAQRLEVAHDPEQLTATDLLAATATRNGAVDGARAPQTVGGGTP
ncbi:MAG: AAA family ATPase, partial [Carbonactinosporaceae bacterium]